jgi:O-antigen/teichoic acid export membrane protein
MLKGSLLSLLLKSCGAILSFTLTIVIARLLGAEETGRYFLVLSMVTPLAIAVRMGLDSVVTRQVSSFSVDNDWRQINSLYSVVFRWVIFTSVLVSLFSFCSGSWLSVNIFDKPELIPVWDLFLWAIIPFSLYSIQGQFFQGVKMMPGFMFSQGLGLPLFLLLILTIFWSVEITLTASLLAASYVVASFFVMAVLVFFWFKIADVQLAKPKRLGALVPSALPLWGIQILGQVLQWAGPIALGIWAMSADVAIFSVAYRTALLIPIVLMAVNSIAAPKFAAQYHQNDMRGLHQVAIWSTRLMLIASMPVVGIFLLFPKWVMGLFGPEFAEGSAILMVLAMGQLVNVATGSVGFLLSMTGHERELLKSTVITVVLMLILCSWLIPTYGIMGAAIAQSASLSVQMFINSWFVKRALGFMPMNVFAKVS